MIPVTFLHFYFCFCFYFSELSRVTQKLNFFLNQFSTRGSYIFGQTKKYFGSWASFFLSLSQGDKLSLVYQALQKNLWCNLYWIGSRFSHIRCWSLLLTFKMVTLGKPKNCNKKLLCKQISNETIFVI